MKYISTRGAAPTLDFEQVLLAGSPGRRSLRAGELPEFSAAEIAAMRGLDYPELALEIMRPLSATAFPTEDLKAHR